MDAENGQVGSPRRLKLVAGIAAVVLAAGALAVGLLREANRAGQPEAPAVTATTADDPAAYAAAIVYYFHGDARCPTCRAIEARTTEVINTHFSLDLASGRLLFQVVNIDTPQARHFRDDYSLAFATVVVQGVGGDRPWEKLDKVWPYIHGDPAIFEQYLVDRITPMLDRPG